MNIKTKLRNYLISGTLIIVPAAISVWILWKIFIFLEGFIGQWLQKTIPNLYVKGLGLVSLIVLIFILGFLAHNVFGKRILRYIEKYSSQYLFLTNYITLSIRFSNRFSEKRNWFFMASH